MYTSISAAAAAANPGDTILVYGMVDGSGNPLPYSQQQVTTAQQTTGQVENFPLAIQLKEGCTLKKAGTLPVYVWSWASGAATTLIEVVEQSGSSNAVTRIESLRLAGAATGVKVHHGGHDTTTVIKDVKFAHLETAVDARASGSDISVAIRDCQLRDDAIVTTIGISGPDVQSPIRGYWLRATQLSNPGHLIAEVKNHSSSGPFANMNPQPWGSIWDQQAATPSGTRVIDIHAEGNVTEYSGLPGNYARNRISEVRLDIEGGLFDGHASDGGTGWDVAVFADALGTGALSSTYNSGYEVSISGAELTDFRMSGIAAMAPVNTRGLIEIHGGTSIHGNAPGATPSGESHNGIHLVQEEGYLGLVATDSIIAQNAGNGIWMDAKGELIGVAHLEPEGLYIEMDKVGLHGNGRSGLRGDVGRTHAGVVGGTSHYSDPENLGIRVRNLMDDGEGFALPFGTGLVDSCRISNNGIGGIVLTTYGDPLRGFKENSPDLQAETVSFRVSNTAVWNNPPTSSAGSGGLLVDVGGLEGVPKALILLPVTHCTFVNNGGAPTSGGWSVEYDDPLAEAAYQWARPHESDVLRTALFNSVLFRDYQTPDPAGDSEFGPSLENILGVYDDDGFAPFPLRGILMCGLRADTSVIPGSAGVDHFNKAAHVFVGPLSMAGYSAAQFHQSGGGLSFLTTPRFLSAHAPETDFDYDDLSRPSVSSGDRDKGMDEQ